MHFRRVARRLSIAILAISSLGALMPGLAEAKVTMTITGIKGDNGADAIPISSYSWGLNNVIADVGGGGGGGRTDFRDLTVVKDIDASSPRLYERGVKGTHIVQVVVRVYRPGTNKLLSSIKLQDVVVSSFTQYASASDTKETVSFNYDTNIMSYFEMKADGTLRPPILFGWNLSSHLAV